MAILERFSLKGRNALVTGAGRGIGRSLACALGEAGANVLIADIDANTAEDAVRELSRLGVGAKAFEADVTASDQVERMVADSVSAFGRLDIAVNNAGIAHLSSVEDLSEADWEDVIGINLKAVFLCCREEGRVMLEQGSGTIINIASMSGRIVNRPQPQAHYNASKAGVVQLTRSCAAEWAARGVRVNCISPGHTRTPMTDKVIDEMGDDWISNTPMGRLGETRDLQGAAVFLASDAASYITGHDLVVDGGYTIW